jgi:hypothetical protein
MLGSESEACCCRGRRHALLNAHNKQTPTPKYFEKTSPAASFCSPLWAARLYLFSDPWPNPVWGIFCSDSVGLQSSETA